MGELVKKIKIFSNQKLILIILFLLQLFFVVSNFLMLINNGGYGTSIILPALVQVGLIVVILLITLIAKKYNLAAKILSILSSFLTASLGVGSYFLWKEAYNSYDIIGVCFALLLMGICIIMFVLNTILLIYSCANKKYVDVKEENIKRKYKAEFKDRVYPTTAFFVVLLLIAVIFNFYFASNVKSLVSDIVGLLMIQSLLVLFIMIVFFNKKRYTIAANVLTFLLIIVNLFQIISTYNLYVRSMSVEYYLITIVTILMVVFDIFLLVYNGIKSNDVKFYEGANENSKFIRNTFELELLHLEELRKENRINNKEYNLIKNKITKKYYK